MPQGNAAPGPGSMQTQRLTVPMFGTPDRRESSQMRRHGDAEQVVVCGQRLLILRRVADKAKERFV